MHQTEFMRIEVNQHLFLETVEEIHAHSIYDLVEANRKFLQRWMPWVSGSTSINDINKFVVDSQAQFKENNGFNSVICFDSTLCGVIGMHRVDWANKSVAIGYWLAEGYQGKGIMTNSCRAIIDHCFNSMDLHRVEIKCATTNYKSQAVPKRLGFKQEGVLRESEYLNGHFIDHILFALIKHKHIEQHFI